MLNNIEKFVIEEFLKSRGGVPSSLDLKLVKVEERSFSGVGFMTEIESTTKPMILDEEEDYTGCELVVKLNNLIDSGYVLYVRNGLLEAIEGHTYNGEEWPEKIQTYTLVSAKN